MREKDFAQLLKVISIIVGVASVILGLTVLVGWYTGAVMLIQVLPSFVPMQYNTALGFLLSGTGILAYLNKRTPVAALCGFIVSLIGLLTLMEYIFYVNLGIDEFFMKHYVGVKTSHMGRMAPNTALSFSLSGLAVIMMSSCDRLKRCALITAILAALVVGLGIIAFSGYLTGIEAAYGWGHLTQMAVHTAFGFVILGTGLSALAWLKEQECVHEVPYWIPVPLAIAVLTFSISLWQALHHDPLVNDVERVSHHFILLFGVVLAFALALTVNLMQKSFRQRELIKRAHGELEIRVRERTEELANTNKELLAQIAERQRAEQELEQKRRLAIMGEMSTHIAHEIRNPLNKVSLSYELLSNSKSIEGNDREALKIMGEEIENLVSLATDLLDYGRRGELKKETFSYKNFIENIIKEIEWKTEKAAIEVQVNLPLKESLIKGDKVKIHQIILNMLNNAIEAMPHGGTLVIEGEDKEGRLKISVSDTGIGIKKADLDKVFLPFFTTKSIGTGLGMAISKQLANLHGGDIMVESEPGEGTKVTVILPRGE